MPGALGRLWRLSGIAAAAVALAVALAPGSLAASGARAAGGGAADGPHNPAEGAALGKIDFPTSGAAAAQPEFERGVLLLHSFEYDDAAAAFREAERLDPGFAMAYWGEAMTYNHPLWHQQDRQAARAALERLAPTADERLAKAPTAREKAYLSAVEVLYGEGDKATLDGLYATAMERLAASTPDDLEAASIYSLALLGTCETGRDIATYMRAAAAAEDVFARNPLHPGAVHYLIHAYDDPVHAPLGLRAARVYARIAPAAAHALHMPSHIFLALGMWDEVAASNEASWAASEARRLRLRLAIEERGYHALSWLQYAYLQQGRFRDARKLLAEMAADAASSGSARTREHLARMQAAWRIETRRFAADAGVLPDLAGLGDDVAAAALFAHGLAALRSGDPAGARRDLALIDERLATAILGAASAGGHAAGHGPDHAGGGSYGGGGATVAGDPAQRSAAILRADLAAQLVLDGGGHPRAGGAGGGASTAPRAERQRQALAAIERAAADEDAASYEFGPPVVVKPAHELAGELLLDLGRPAEARRHFEQALARAPRRSLSLLGLARAAARSGDAAAARQAYADLARSWRQADPDLPELAEVGAARP
jgi:tetratricopeptide (TPR) repeat protein